MREYRWSYSIESIAGISPTNYSVSCIVKKQVYLPRNFTLKGKTKGTPLWGTRRLKVVKRYHLRL